MENATLQQTAIPEQQLNSLGLLVGDHVTAMLAYWDKNQVCRFANNAYREWFGLSKEQMINKMTMKEVLGPLYEPNLPHIHAVLAGKPQTFERSIPLPGGGVRHSIANYFPDIQNGDVKGFVVHVADVTSMKKMEIRLMEREKELIELNAYKDRLVSVIAHDLKSYFTINYTTVEYLISDYDKLSKADILEYLQILEKNNSRTVFFLDELSDWVRNTLNMIVYNAQKLDVKAEVKTIIGFFYKQILDKDIAVKTFVREGTYAFGDAIMFRTVIRNLLSNAIKFSLQGGSIIIKAELKNGMVVCSVKDHGVGMNETLYAKIMSGGSYESSFGTKGEKGIGLGLGLTREFIEKNNGKMWITTALHKGTTFYFTIPAFS